MFSYQFRFFVILIFLTSVLLPLIIFLTCKIIRYLHQRQRSESDAQALRIRSLLDRPHVRNHLLSRCTLSEGAEISNGVRKEIILAPPPSYDALFGEPPPAYESFQDQSQQRASNNITSTS